VIALGRMAALALAAAMLPASLGADAGASTPGRAHQTNVETSFGPALTAQMRLLWRAIEADSPAVGSTVFFPRDAYLQMKTGVIAEPSSDYANRLVAFFRLDLAAYRRVIGASSKFQRVASSPGDAAWIAPGACENRVGYWHVPGVRLVFVHRGVVESVAVASLISWRGVWYVVHLGPNPRPRDVGTVDGFQRGPGTPGPPGGC
jgi:hypothetical protein